MIPFGGRQNLNARLASPPLSFFIFTLLLKLKKLGNV
jgi:hypothetical protein